MICKCSTKSKIKCSTIELYSMYYWYSTQSIQWQAHSRSPDAIFWMSITWFVGKTSRTNDSYGFVSDWKHICEYIFIYKFCVDLEYMHLVSKTNKNVDGTSNNVTRLQQILHCIHMTIRHKLLIADIKTIDRNINISYHILLHEFVFVVDRFRIVFNHHTHRWSTAVWHTKTVLTAKYCRSDQTRFQWFHRNAFNGHR